ncbi:MAG: hypothetical protein MZU91_09685 [Desulfosudis oleivorans]|nr:hypothetical protein [Desulfosudis oleivorans]
MQRFLQAIGKQYLFDQLGSHARRVAVAGGAQTFGKTGARGQVRWQNTARKSGKANWVQGVSSVICRVWIAHRSGLFTTGELRRFVPVWANEKYLPPCQAACPTGIPVQKRWELIRQGKVDEAVDLALQYTPFPATVCGYLCPNLCMQNCTRHLVSLQAVDVTLLGKASLSAKEPKRLPKTGKKVAVIGGGASGLSVAWQLWLKGHEAVIIEAEKAVGR